MLKKVMALLLTLSLATMCLSGCGAQGETSTEPAETQEQAAEESVETQEKQAGETITLRLSSNHTEDFVTSKAVDYFAEQVKERTNGEVVIECYYNAVLGEEKAAAEQLQYGGIDFARLSLSCVSEFVDILNGLQMPFIYENVDHFWRVMDSEEVGEKILKSEEMQNVGFYGLCYFDGGSRSFFMKDTEVHTPADLEGKTIRVQESSLMTGMVKALGANPTAMPSSDVYSSLQTGVIDGAENNLPFYLSQSYNEVAKFICLDEHTRVPDSIIMSTAVKDKVSEEQLAIIEECAKEASQLQRKLWSESEAESVQQCIDLGCTVIELSSEEKALFMEAVEELNATEGAAYKDILDAIAALK